MATVELNVRTQLQRIINELDGIAKASEKVGDSLGDASKSVGDDVNKQTKKTEGYLADLQRFGGRVANQLKNDFKSLVSINAIAGSLKFSEMFRGSIKETVTLSDSIRKLGSTLGIAGGEAQKFQDKMTKALAAKGLSSVAGANALSGLAETGVRGEGNLMAYATQSGMLASISRQQGSEGGIAKGIAGVVTARGGNVNDVQQLQAVAQDVLRIRMATGKSATEILDAMNQLFSGANKQFQKRLQGGGATTLASAALFGGKDATSFLEKYLKMNQYQRQGAEAQGLGRIVGKDGSLNLAAMESTLAEARARGMGDEQAGLTTFGMSDEEAQGFIRLTAAMRNNQAAIEGARQKQVDINRTYRDSVGLGEAFSNNLNRVKGLVSGPLSYATQKTTGLLGEASQSTGGALAVTGGAGLLAALLAGGGLRGVGKGLGGGLLKGAAIEGATGRQVQPVYVVNAAEIGGGGVLGGLAGGAMSGGKGGGALGMLGKAGLVAGAGYLAYDSLSSRLPGSPEEADSFREKIKNAGGTSDGIPALLRKLDQWISISMGSPSTQRVKVELNDRELKVSRQPSRGASFGP